MASGAVPVVFERPGAHDQYLDEWVHASADAAARAILRVRDQGWRREGTRAREYAAQHWTWDTVEPVWNEILGLESALRQTQPS
jgi:hypothetical protein